MIILEPRLHFGASDQEMAQPRKMALCCLYSRLCFPRTVWNNISRHIRLAEKAMWSLLYNIAHQKYHHSLHRCKMLKQEFVSIKKKADEYHIDVDHMAVAGDSSEDILH